MRRVRAVIALVQAGASLSDAVERLALDDQGPDSREEARARLWEALDAFDEHAAMEVLSAAAVTPGVPGLLDDVLVPVLRQLGDEWRLSPRNIAREHFASTLIRSHLVSLLPGHEGSGSPCLAFCPEGEPHDIGLLMAAVTVATTGRDVIVVGGQTPSASVEALRNELRPPVILVAAITRRPAARLLGWWRPRRAALTLAGGAGFRPADKTRLGGLVHTGPYSEIPALLDPHRGKTTASVAPPRRRS